MQIHTSYKAAFHACIDTQTYAIAHLNRLSKNMQIDTSGCYKIFFCLSGDKQFHVDDYTYTVNPDALFFITPREWHYFSHFDDNAEHERFVIFIYPEYIKKWSSENTDLTSCFSHDHSLQHNLHLNVKEKEQFLHFIHQISSNMDWGQDLLDFSLFIKLLVFINHLALNHRNQSANTFANKNKYDKTLNEIVSYLDTHISEELSINSLAEQFFLSPAHLQRMFKSTTGTTIHKYITAKRITLAKDYLAEGYTTSDVAMKCGYNDFNAFFKAFVRETGVSPKKYAKFTV